MSHGVEKKPAEGRHWFVYLLRCANGRLYTGITTDLGARFAKHASGRGAMFTRLNRPSHIVAAKLCEDRSEASKLEYAIKNLKLEQKLALAATWPAIENLPRFMPLVRRD